MCECPLTGRYAAGDSRPGDALPAHRELLARDGSEFWLPLLIGLFGFVALQTVIVNKAMSLVSVLTALPTGTQLDLGAAAACHGVRRQAALEGQRSGWLRLIAAPCSQATAKVDKYEIGYLCH